MLTVTLITGTSKLSLTVTETAFKKMPIKNVNLHIYVLWIVPVRLFCMIFKLIQKFASRDQSSEDKVTQIGDFQNDESTLKPRITVSRFKTLCDDTVMWRLSKSMVSLTCGRDPYKIGTMRSKSLLTVINRFVWTTFHKSEENPKSN